ncbi:hypothetical protein SAY87_004162 [Trapa incisa]|uniref:VQ domain-containing protein n=1 Tax=Trapa incisa TaxID=236973 RepID=A0AAN7PS03_9MYRT|nr:hypothetical protein SAY87_004162 [Trapa incisa]
MLVGACVVSLGIHLTPYPYLYALPCDGRQLKSQSKHLVVVVPMEEEERLQVWRRKEPLKVVIIDTQYVEMDAESFKSVVQRLTRKDSTVNFNSKQCMNAGVVPPPCSGFTGAESWAVNVSEGGGWWIREFDLLLKEMPLQLPPPANQNFFITRCTFNFNHYK